MKPKEVLPLNRSRVAWIEKYGQHPNVQAWLRDNPPPKDWPESPESYAYTEMPIWVLGWNSLRKGLL